LTSRGVWAVDSLDSKLLNIAVFRDRDLHTGRPFSHL
jgi:hypothetical protein